MRRLLAITVLLLLAACRTSAPPRAPSGLPTELGEAPSSLTTQSPGPGGGTGSPGSTPGASPPGGGPTATASPTKSGPVHGPFRAIGSAADRLNDHGALAPGYTDLVGVQLLDVNVDARAIVTYDAPIPNPMPAGEQMAVGVDLYRASPGTGDSDYQLFALGNEDGWLAFLDTPTGFVDYPGAFAIQGSSLVFQVPWSFLGNIRGKSFSTFSDWDRVQPVVNRVAEDRVPDFGTANFSR